ncbi:hypothetical protein E4U42_007583 [Claviceps africana]|uniref:Uncharacterized protein n=1 Tax=Claviceps africana TaxID=83212 RepID=A0A8K0NL14_9HYPO|nr:hypothetical protein E4U42_007583 [Claviceps africana]
MNDTHPPPQTQTQSVEFEFDFDWESSPPFIGFGTVEAVLDRRATQPSATLCRPHFFSNNPGRGDEPPHRGASRLSTDYQNAKWSGAARTALALRGMT